jgi:hypothetical protein
MQFQVGLYLKTMNDTQPNAVMAQRFQKNLDRLLELGAIIRDHHIIWNWFFETKGLNSNKQRISENVTKYKMQFGTKYIIMEFSF